MKKISSKSIIVIFLLLVSVEGLRAQQEANLMLYRYHLNVINPAVVGLNGESWVNASFRRQWVNVPDAPETGAFSFGVPVGNKLGMGLTFVQDRTFVERQTGVFMDFSYHISLGQTSKLYFGLKAGGSNYAITTSELETYNNQTDLALTDTSVFSPNIGVGLYLAQDQFYLALSAPRLFISQKAGDANGTATLVSKRPHFYASTGYDFIVSDRFEFSPSAWVQYVNGAPLATTVLAMFTYSDRISLGMSYRTAETLSGIFSIKVNNRFVFGYGYESTLNQNLRADMGITHEFIVRLLLGKRD